MSASNATDVVSQSRLYGRMLCVLAAISVGVSFVEADRRGLLFDSDPFAFAVEDSALAVSGASGSPAMMINRFPGPVRDRGPRAGRPTGPGSAPAVQPAAVQQGAGPSGASRIIPSAEGPFIGSASGTTSTTESLDSSGTQLLGQGVPGGGFLDSPIGLIAVSTGTGPTPPDPPGPVVPAIPEPASWILMIIGLAWLGLYLRSQKMEDPVLA